MSVMIDTVGTATAKARYNRIAPLYDRIQTMSERAFKPFRKRLWAQAQGKVLEVGVGTGLNISFYPQGVRVTAMDLSDQMLARAQERA